VAKKNSTDPAMVFLGLLAWAIAGTFGFFGATATAPPSGRTEVPSLNFAAGGAAAGFAIAGGLCFLGAALASRNNVGRDDNTVP
jgi:hypothetical protein